MTDADSGRSGMYISSRCAENGRAEVVKDKHNLFLLSWKVWKCASKTVEKSIFEGKTPQICWYYNGQALEKC